jgi:phosphate-selective porin OprO/OprP
MQRVRLHLCVIALLAGVWCPTAGAERPERPSWEFSWWPKLEWRRSDGEHVLRLGGRALFDVAAIDYGDELLGRTGPAGWDVASEVRQGRIFFSGRFFRRIEVKTEVDFAAADPDPALTDAYVGLRDIGPVHFVRFGHQKIPFSFENQMSRPYMVFMERSLANSLDPSVRDVGIRAEGSLLDQRLRWVLGGFRDTENTGRFFTEPTNWTAALRFTGLPYVSPDEEHLLHLGASFSRSFRGGGGSFRVRQRPESNLADFLIDTGSIEDVDAVNRVQAEVVWLDGPFAFQGEWTHELLDRRAGGGDLDFVAFYIHASWFVTGEHREYDRTIGHFGAVHPNRDFDPGAGGWGAVQLAARLSYADLNDGDVRGGSQMDLTLGANWFLFPFLRLTFNWVHGWVFHQDDVDVLQARFQVTY